MASIDLGGTLKALKGERAKVHQDLTKLDKAIAVLKELSGQARRAKWPRGNGPSQPPPAEDRQSTEAALGEGATEAGG